MLLSVWDEGFISGIHIHKEIRRWFKCVLLTIVQFIFAVRMVRKKMFGFTLTATVPTAIITNVAARWHTGEGPVFCVSLTFNRGRWILCVVVSLCVRLLLATRVFMWRFSLTSTVHTAITDVAARWYTGEGRVFCVSLTFNRERWILCVVFRLCVRLILAAYGARVSLCGFTITVTVPSAVTFAAANDVTWGGRIICVHFGHYLPPLFIRSLVILLSYQSNWRRDE
jgi:hypothetical protein